jgi:NAD(P)-dependent dehydrogenase (short-subunit alcohol dehydrogenase family)
MGDAETGAAIITGSDSGIGKAAAVALARRGYDIGVTWHSDQAGAEDTARQVRDAGSRAEVRRLDLADLDGVQPLVGELAEALGGLDVFVNNSGTGRSAPFLELSLEDWEHVIRVNLTGAFLAPGEIATPMTGAEDQDPRELERPAIPAGRPGHAWEIAEWIAFLASPQSSYATGESIVVDGGLLLMAAVANQDA